MTKTRLALLCLAASAPALLDAGRADACGGCFVPASEATVVTDHRMALSVSPQQTVLWDQIRYSGDPREFAWVLPVRAGAKIEVANDEFFSALDASSQPIVYAPRRFGGNACALTGCASSDDATSAGASGENGVQILSQSVVGPYEQVTLRATDDGALVSWLRKNDFSIPPSIESTIEAYVGEGFDFIALKLRPECGERSMRPVRVVWPGADPTLPLRMVAAGVGARVGITLYVITEGRYEPQNFESTLIDDRDLRWNRFDNKSNYEPLSQEIMARANGRTWITEYADSPQLASGRGWHPPSSSPFGRGGQSNPGLSDTYYGLCKSYRAANPPRPSGSPNTTPSFTPCPDKDAGEQDQTPLDAGKDAAANSDAGDAGDAGNAGDASDAGDEEDGGEDEGGIADAGADADAGSGETRSDAGPNGGRDAGAGSPNDPYEACAYLDDLDLALDGLHRENVWVTRLRATLPVDALKTGDLRLQPAKLDDGRVDPKPVSNIHWAPYFADEDRPGDADQRSCEGAPKQRRTFGGWALAVVSGIFAVSWFRRRRRPR